MYFYYGTMTGNKFPRQFFFCFFPVEYIKIKIKFNVGFFAVMEYGGYGLFGGLILRILKIL
jgi:hypothetical protein